jgi:hypothetical protein
VPQNLQLQSSFFGWGFVTLSPDLTDDFHCKVHSLRAITLQSSQYFAAAIAFAPTASNSQLHRAQTLISVVGSLPCFLALHRCCLQQSGQDTMFLPLSVTHSDPHFMHATRHLLLGGTSVLSTAGFPNGFPARLPAVAALAQTLPAGHVIP